MAQTPDLKLGLLTRIFAALAIAFLATLVIAPAKGVFTQWRDIQERYNEVAARQGVAPIDVRIRQVWLPDLGLVDRCTSCHLGMGQEQALEGVPLFAAHPPIPHDAARIGCTICHAGQGRATEAEAAHGHVAHWEEPLLAAGQMDAGCGTCHSAVQVGSFESVDRGERLVAQRDCLACHRIDGRGGGRLAPAAPIDLSGIGLRGVPVGWHEAHLDRAAAAPLSLAGEAYGPLAAEEEAAIDAYLRTLAGMPRLQAGKRLFHERGCRGCHVVNGVGGTEGADLTRVGLKPKSALVFPAGFPGPETEFAWHVEHLLAPAAVVEDSRMPDQGLPREEAETIALYLLSLRGRALPPNALPPDRVRVEHLGGREFGTDGRTLFGVFCAACHGPAGEGRPYGENREPFPAVAGAGLLAVASDAYLARTIETGRPGRRMPGWRGAEGGLREDEVRRLVAWLRAREPAPPAPDAVRAAAPDEGLGRRTYESECAVCHGANGEGGIGPSLESPAFGSLATPEFLYATLTEGRPGTAMPRFRSLEAPVLASVIAHVRSLSKTAVREPEASGTGDARRGAGAYAASCEACHGPEGRGGRGPAVGKPGLWRAAGEGFVTASYRRGRCVDEAGRRAPGQAAQTLADIAAWLRAMAARPAAPLPGRRAAGSPEAGGRLYARHCASCHGAEGEGREGPALANPAFLRAANDDFLRATILRGREGTAMPRFDRGAPSHPGLSASEVDDVVSFVRGFAAAEEENP